MSAQFYLTIASVLAIVVPSVVVLAWRISKTRADLTATMARLASETSSRCASIESAQQQKSPSTIAARLDALDGAVAELSARHRRDFGRIWGTLGAQRAPNGHDDDVDDDLHALLALQTAPTPKL